jgi:hypothetical protein
VCFCSQQWRQAALLAQRWSRWGKPALTEVVAALRKADQRYKELRELFSGSWGSHLHPHAVRRFMDGDDAALEKLREMSARHEEKRQRMEQMRAVLERREWNRLRLPRPAIWGEIARGKRPLEDLELEIDQVEAENRRLAGREQQVTAAVGVANAAVMLKRRKVASQVERDGDLRALVEELKAEAREADQRREEVAQWAREAGIPLTQPEAQVFRTYYYSKSKGGSSMARCL